MGKLGEGRGLRGVFVRIRIYRIGGIFRISLSPNPRFRIAENPAERNMDKRLPIEARGGRILKIL